MIATKIALLGIGIFFGGWAMRQLIKLSVNELDGRVVMLFMLAGAVLGFFVASELAEFLPQLPFYQPQ